MSRSPSLTLPQKGENKKIINSLNNRFMKKRLRRSTRDCKIAGVCGGLAEYLDIDATVVRIVYILLAFFSAAFPGIILYIIMMLVMPKDNLLEQK